MCARIWDVIILEGDSFVFRVAIAVLGILESRLFFPERKELLEGATFMALILFERADSNALAVAHLPV
jgi:hypothetical protein